MVRSAFVVLQHPALWPTAIRQARRTVAPGWWRRRPYLPVPSGEYLRFRLVTQYGDEQHTPDPGDVLNYLAWCRQWDRG